MTAFDVLVLVGTDHHPFDRLVRWVDDWAAGHPGQPRVLVQRGTSCVPARVESVEYLDSGELVDLMAATPVIVSHGGPSTIAESRRNGKRPVVVPRDSRNGEHVDGHQLLFTARLAQDGLILRAVDEESFRACMNDVSRDRSLLAVQDTGQADVAATSQRFADAVNSLFLAAPQRRALGRRAYVR